METKRIGCLGSDSIPEKINIVCLEALLLLTSNNENTGRIVYVILEQEFPLDIFKSRLLIYMIFIKCSKFVPILIRWFPIWHYKLCHCVFVRVYNKFFQEYQNRDVIFGISETE